MMRSKKSFKWLAPMVGIVLLVVLLGAIPGYAKKMRISLDNSSVAENQPPGTLVGTFTTTHGGGGPYAYSLVEGPGDDDNGSFNIVGDELQTAASFDYETKDTTYKIRVQTEHIYGDTYEKEFTVTVTDISYAPVAVADSYSTDEDTKLTVHAKDGVLSNDTDEDGDRLTATLDCRVSQYCLQSAG